MTTSLSSVSTIHRKLNAYPELAINVDTKHEVAWCYMNGSARPCFTEALLDNLITWGAQVRAQHLEMGIRYHVTASAIPGVYNLGGDLALFRGCIVNRDTNGLLTYGKKCLDALYNNISHFNSSITTIALVQGDALGGGFEAALSSDLIIAEQGTHLGFPEILFNLIPGMGAYNLLSRRLDPARAERIILGGHRYTAEALHEMGVVDILAPKGGGETAVYEYIGRENRAKNGFRALRQVRDLLRPISYEELWRVLEIWVETALRLEGRDLRMMERLIRRQIHSHALSA
jgi:DSF synthase